MSTLITDAVTQLSFALFENKGVFALLLGSGLSRAAEIPTGWEITLDLIRCVATAQGINAQPDWAKWYHDKTGQHPSYSTLLQELAGSSHERRAILHRYIEPTEKDREEGRKIPTAAHRAIAELVRRGYVRVIVTTNFDRLMESALRAIGKLGRARSPCEQARHRRRRAWACPVRHSGKFPFADLARVKAGWTS